MNTLESSKTKKRDLDNMIILANDAAGKLKKKKLPKINKKVKIPSEIVTKNGKSQPILMAYAKESGSKSL